MRTLNRENAQCMETRVVYIIINNNNIYILLYYIILIPKIERES